MNEYKFSVEQKKLNENVFSVSGKQFDAIVDQITAFQKSLDHQYAISFLMGGYGSNIEMQITHIECIEPYTILFKGKVEGKEAVLIQNLNQVNFIMKAVKKTENTNNNPIGFTIS